MGQLMCVTSEDYNLSEAELTERFTKPQNRKYEDSITMIPFKKKMETNPVKKRVLYDLDGKKIVNEIENHRKYEQLAAIRALEAKSELQNNLNSLIILQEKTTVLISESRLNQHQVQSFGDQKKEFSEIINVFEQRSNSNRISKNFTSKFGTSLTDELQNFIDDLFDQLKSDRALEAGIDELKEAFKMGKTKEELNISEELLALISEKAREVLHRTPVEPEILKKISEYNLMQLTSMDKKTTK